MDFISPAALPIKEYSSIRWVSVVSIYLVLKILRHGFFTGIHRPNSVRHPQGGRFVRDPSG